MTDGAEAGPEIVGVRPAVTGIHLTLRCRGCGTSFESYQATVLCVPVGDLVCPSCATRWTVQPQQLDAALAEYLPYQEPVEMKRLTAEATRVAESWHQLPVLAAVLCHRGVALGEAMERELLAVITLGLARAGELAGGEGRDEDAESRP